jgi:hypothetical protein
MKSFKAESSLCGKVANHHQPKSKPEIGGTPQPSPEAAYSRMALELAIGIMEFKRKQLSTTTRQCRDNSQWLLPGLSLRLCSVLW